MVRDVDLVHYLPEYLKEFAEITATLEAEDPEFVLAWKASDEVLQNEFILTADENGIERYEKMLKIEPSEGESLEERRAIVLAEWFSSLPYTWRMLVQRLTALCGEGEFEASNDFSEGGYTVTITLAIDLFNNEKVTALFEEMLPANIIINLKATAADVTNTTYAGLGSMSVYRPEPVRDGYQVEEEAEQIIGVGFAPISFYKSVVKED